MKLVVIIFLTIILFSCGTQQKLVSPVKINGKYGFIDSYGNWFIEPRFDSVGIFYDGFADIFKNGKNGLINSKGKIIVEPKFDFIGHIEDKVALIITDNKYNYVNLKGDLISNIYFYDAEDFSNGLACVRFHHKGKWGYINTSGKLQIDTLFRYATDFIDGKAEVEINKQACVIDKTGKIIDAVIAKTIIKKQFYLIGSYNGTLGRINQAGDTIMKPIYKSFGHIQNGLFWFNENDLFGIADTTGKIIVKPIYEDLSYFSDNGLALARLNGKYGFISEDGHVAIDFIFQAANGFKYNLAAVMFDGKWGFINSKGDFIIKPIYENILSQFRPVNSKSEPMYSIAFE